VYGAPYARGSAAMTVQVWHGAGTCRHGAPINSDEQRDYTYPLGMGIFTLRISSDYYVTFRQQLSAGARCPL